MRQIEYATNCWRRIAFPETTFSFKLLEISGALGQEFIDIIRSFKRELGPIVSELKLPRLVRVLVSDIVTPDARVLAIYIHPEANRYFNIQIDLEQLHEFEVSITDEYYRVQMIAAMLEIFLHECVHFNISDEKETQRITKQLLKRVLKKRVQRNQC